MNAAKKLGLLFGAYLAGGNATILQNLEEAIAGRPDVDPSFLRIEMDAESKELGKRQRRHLVPGTFRNSYVTGREIQRLERAGARFDAAYFFQQTICMFLWEFRSRVPYLVAMDGTPLWYAAHDLWYAQPRFDPESLTARVKHELTRRVYAGAAHLLPLSRSCRESLVNDYGIAPERITVVPPGVNLQRFACPDRRAAPAAKPIDLLFVGADFHRKGGDLLVAMAARPEYRDVRFHFVTKAYEGPRGPNVSVYDDVQTNTDRMVRLFAQADLFVLPTRADSHSIASLEAMAMGLPVVATPVGGIRDVVAEGETGFLVPPDDAVSLERRVRQLLGDRELRLRLGQAGRARVEERFDNQKVAATVVDLMKAAAAGRRA